MSIDSSNKYDNTEDNEVVNPIDVLVPNMMEEKRNAEDNN